jgi:phosphatidylserine/phosphatidylglycerophosphate/cardiolipin synthase-like enzyme
VNVAIRNEGTTARLMRDFEADLADSREMTLARWHARPFFEKLVGPVAWILERQQ